MPKKKKKKMYGGRLGTLTFREYPWNWVTATQGRTTPALACWSLRQYSGISRFLSGFSGPQETAGKVTYLSCMGNLQVLFFFFLLPATFSGSVSAFPVIVIFLCLGLAWLGLAWLGLAWLEPTLGTIGPDKCTWCGVPYLRTSLRCLHLFPLMACLGRQTCRKHYRTTARWCNALGVFCPPRMHRIAIA